MSSWQGKSSGNVLGYKIFVYILKHLGIAWGYSVLYFVAFYFWIFKPKTFASSYFYFRKIQKFSAAKAFFSVYRQYLLLGKILIDKTAILSGLQAKFTIDHDGADHIDTIVKGGRGGMLISSHMGNWETAGQLLERINYTFNIVMVDAEHEKIKAYLGQVMTKRNFNIIPIKDDMSHVFLIKEALNRNELIVMHGDRFVDKQSAVELSFMGYKAWFPSGPFFIATKFDIPVSFAFAFKETNRHYHFYASEPVQYKLLRGSSVTPNATQILMHDYLESLEKMVRRYPHQWFNFYNFWNKKS